jgi:branched-chain amino acid aminotransferase
MADRDGFIWLDGKLLPWREAKTHVLTHALHYGSAVFEGERIYDGRVFRLSAHSARPWAQEGRLSVQAKPGGINVTMAKYRRPAPEVAPGEAKVAGLYIICGIEKDRALKAGFDDALMLDWRGRLAESTGANIFLVPGGTGGGKLVTPKVENFLDGITRRAVIGMAARRGWAVDQRAVMPEELAEANEVFLCGTAAEIVPVGAIDQCRYQVGPMTRTLIDDYARLVRQPDCEGFGESAHFATA